MNEKEGHCFDVDYFPLPVASDVSCSDVTYRCKNNKCISKVNPECDGTPDCDDGSDEENCGMSQTKIQWAHVVCLRDNN